MKQTNSKSQLILNTALQLFMAHGYRAVSLERIASESGITKMTVYRYFANKDILIEAVLMERDKNFRASLESYINKSSLGIDGLKAIFDWHQQWFSEKTFRGCMFINAISEFSNEKRNLFSITKHHKKMIENIIEKNLLGLVSKDKAALLASQINMLLDGAIVSVQTDMQDNPASIAWSMAEHLIKLEMTASTTAT